MPHALYAFEHPDAARRARNQLIARGLPPRAVRLHEPDAGPHDEVVAAIDEQATGGFVRNLYGLFQGVFDWGSSPHDASAYAETIRRGGAVVSVEGETELERTQTEEVMLLEGPIQCTGWSELPR